MRVIRLLTAILGYLVGYAFLFLFFTLMFDIGMFILAKFLKFTFCYYYGVIAGVIIVTIMILIQLDIISARRKLAKTK